MPVTPVVVAPIIAATVAASAASNSHHEKAPEAWEQMTTYSSDMVGIVSQHSHAPVFLLVAAFLAFISLLVFAIR